MTTEQYKGEHTGLDLLKVGSKEVFTDNISKIGQLFPEVLTEKRDKHGRLRPAIDFEKLKQFLSEELLMGESSMNLPGLESVKPSQKLDDQQLKPCDQTLMRALTLIRVKISSSLGTILKF